MSLPRPLVSGPVGVRASGPFGEVELTGTPGELVALISPAGTAGLGHVATTLTVGDGAHRPRRLARLGVAHVPAGLALFPSLSVEDHLELGRVQRRRPDRTAEVLEWLPELAPLASRRAGLLSGGEQRLLAVARALVGSPRILLVEDTTTGLAPRSADRVVRALRSAAQEWGTAVVAADYRERPLVDLADTVLHLTDPDRAAHLGAVDGGAHAGAGGDASTRRGGGR